MHYLFTERQVSKHAAEVNPKRVLAIAKTIRDLESSVQETSRSVTEIHAFMPEDPDTPTPTVFISYSWTTPTFSERIRNWADRLIGEGGVQVILDQYDLKEGHDKHAFMERMVTDSNVTHVLIFSDKRYAEKADGRKGGVGTESTIISQKVYSQVAQTKFIPIFCEKDEMGEPYVPTFLGGRIGFDFSTPEKENENWEPLIRALHGKPAHQKPSLGRPPAYILADQALPTVAAAGKFAALRQVIVNGGPRASFYRDDFLDACIEFADHLRVRQRPNDSTFAAKSLEEFTTLASVRDYLTNWVLLEAASDSSQEFSDALNKLLERLLVLRARPPELTQWQPEWFAVMSMFVYETALYLIAALLKRNAHAELHKVLSTTYLIPDTEFQGHNRFQSFDGFNGHCGVLAQSVSSPDGRRFLSPTAELLKRRANRIDLPFPALMEAEVLIYLMSILRDSGRWRPQTFVYADWSTAFPLFLRAEQHTGFRRLALITGIPAAETLKIKAREGLVKHAHNLQFGYGWGPEILMAQALNLEKLDEHD